MRWRMITEEDVRVVIDNPDQLENTIKGRKNAFKVLGDKTLKITYKCENEDIILITAMVKGD